MEIFSKRSCDFSAYKLLFIPRMSFPRVCVLAAGDTKANPSLTIPLLIIALLIFLYTSLLLTLWTFCAVMFFLIPPFFYTGFFYVSTCFYSKFTTLAYYLVRLFKVSIPALEFVFFLFKMSYSCVFFVMFVILSTFYDFDLSIRTRFFSYKLC